MAIPPKTTAVQSAGSAPSHEDAVREHDRHHERLLKANEAAIQAGQVAIRTAVVINGGAAISILAFIGGLVGQGRLAIEDIRSVADSLLPFAVGVVCGLGSLGASYLAQYCVRTSNELVERVFSPPYLYVPPGAARWSSAATAMRAIGVLAGVGSVALFVAGMLDVHHAISGLHPPVAQSSISSVHSPRMAPARRLPRPGAASTKSEKS